MKLFTYMFMLFWGVSAPSYAGVEFLGFSDIDHNEIVIPAADVDYVRNDSAITFSISSGIDRRLHAIAKRDGVIVFDDTTNVINTSDRVEVHGKAFYGKNITIDDLRVDGDYTVEISTLDLSGKVVASELYHFKRDTVPPVIDDKDISWVRAGYSLGSIDDFADSYATFGLKLNSVKDNNSGLQKAQYWVKNKHFPRVTVDALLHKNSDFQGGVSIRAKQAANKALFPQDRYTIGFDIFDNAGNVSTISRQSNIDSHCPSTGPTVEVYNPLTGGWEPYVSGMVVHANPVKMRWGRLSKDFAVNNDSFGWSGAASSEPVTYYTREFIYPQTRTYFEMFNKAGLRCFMGGLSSIKLTLADGVDEAPGFTGAEFKTTLNSNWVRSTTIKYNQPFTLTTVKVKVPVRTYRQRAWIPAVGADCYIEIGETSCESKATATYSSGRGYSPKPIYVGREDKSWAVHVSYLYFYWDMNPIIIEGVTHNTSQSVLIARLNDPDTVSDWRSYMWTIRSLVVQYINKTTGNEGSITSKSYVMNDTNHRVDTVDVSYLEDGEYTFTFVATDSYGNVSSEKLDSYIDNNAPVIDVNYDTGSGLPKEINKLENIKIKLTDVSDSTLVSARLYGSSSNDDVFLGLINHADNTYSVERPRIFPTLLDGEHYTLEFIAKDKYENVSTKSVTFKYMIDNLIVMDTQYYLPININLKTKDNHPIASIYSTSPLEVEGGMLATGIQLGNITSRINSDISINIMTANGVVSVAPGETKEISIDLGDSGKPLSLDIFPSQLNEIGRAELMFDIQSLRSKWSEN